MTFSARFDERLPGRMTPLVTAEAGFPALEDLALDATQTLWIGYRIFDPATRLRGRGREVADDWAGLLRHKLRDGIEIRILLSDFEVLARAELHRSTWESIAQLTAIAREVPAADLHLLPVLHDARAEGMARWLLAPAAIAALHHRIRELNALSVANRREAFAHLPGLWPAVRLGADDRAMWRFGRLPRLTPATLHQKIAVADGQRAMIGGLDLDERRYDTPTHDRPAEETWHDVSVTVDGCVATDIARHFAEQWNHHRITTARILRKYAVLDRGKSSLFPTTPSFCPLPVDIAPEPVKPAETAGSDPGTADCSGAPDQGGHRLIRTISTRAGPGNSPVRFFPRPYLREIREAHLDLIGDARRLIYIETQFFRSRRIAHALARAASRNPDLGLILILPAAPEDVAFNGRRSLAERFGDHLQTQCLDRVAKNFAGRIAILSPARKIHDPNPGRQRIARAELIYVHAKVIIAGGVGAIVSSANLNERSLSWDTEAGILCRNPTDVARLQEALFRHWHPETDPIGAGGRTDTGATIAAAWATYAEAEATRAPAKRQSLLVPHATGPARAEAVAVPGAPDELV